LLCPWERHYAVSHG